MSAPSRALTTRDQRHDLILAAAMFVGGILSAALSGTIELGPRERGGWRIRAQVPLRANADLAAVGS